MVLSEWLFSLILSRFLPVSFFLSFFLNPQIQYRTLTLREFQFTIDAAKEKEKYLNKKEFCMIFFLLLNPSAKSFDAIVSQHSSINAYISPYVLYTSERTCIAINLRWYTNAHFFCFVSDDCFFSFYPLFCGNVNKSCALLLNKMYVLPFFYRIPCVECAAAEEEDGI